MGLERAYAYLVNLLWKGKRRKDDITDDIDAFIMEKATVVRGNMYFFNVKDAYKIIALLAYRRVMILGIEGFRLDDKYIMPDIGLITDFSSLLSDGTKDPYAESIYYAIKFMEFVEDEASDAYFEFVLKTD